MTQYETDPAFELAVNALTCEGISVVDAVQMTLAAWDDAAVDAADVLEFQ